jgi:hypothetical protein
MDKSDIYDVDSYTDAELLDILDLNNPSDRELEARIIMLIQKYRGLSTSTANQLTVFFENIYNRFFSEEEEEADKEDIVEGFEQQIDTPLDVKTNDPSRNNNDIKQPTNNVTAVLTPPPVNYTKQLEFVPDKLNPLLTQTITRIVSIDSQYRDDKRSFTTDFTLNLSEPLKNVVSIKLYSIQLPYTWYTVNENYGSNFFYLKGTTPGINNGNHDISFIINPGNYNAVGLSSTINKSIQATAINSDVNLGSTYLDYNAYTGLSTITVDVSNVYTESSYYVTFNNNANIQDSSGWTTPMLSDTSRNLTIPSFLGFQKPTYYPFAVNSQQIINYDTVNNTFLNTTQYTLNSSNSFITVYKYTSPLEKINGIVQNISYVDCSNIPGVLDFYFNINLLDSLTPTLTDTQSNLYLLLKQKIANSPHLTSESTINIVSNNTPVSSNPYLNQIFPYSYFQLLLKHDRYSNTKTYVNTKLAVQFPNESTIWTGLNSCFGFSNNNNTYFSELNVIHAETQAVKETGIYSITSTPYVQLICNADGFNTYDNKSFLNDFRIDVPNNSNPGYTIDQYMAAINYGIQTATSLKGTTLPTSILNASTSPSSKAFMSTNKFNLQLSITKIFDETMYTIDLTNSVLSNLLQFENLNNSYLLNKSLLTEITTTYPILTNVSAIENGNLVSNLVLQLGSISTIGNVLSKIDIQNVIGTTSIAYSTPVPPSRAVLTTVTRPNGTSMTTDLSYNSKIVLSKNNFQTNVSALSSKSISSFFNDLSGNLLVNSFYRIVDLSNVFTFTYNSNNSLFTELASSGYLIDISNNTLINQLSNTSTQTFVSDISNNFTKNYTSTNTLLFDFQYNGIFSADTIGNIITSTVTGNMIYTDLNNYRTKNFLSLTTISDNLSYTYNNTNSLYTDLRNYNIITDASNSTIIGNLKTTSTNTFTTAISNNISGNYIYPTNTLLTDLLAFNFFPTTPHRYLTLNNDNIITDTLIYDLNTNNSACLTKNFVNAISANIYAKYTGTPRSLLLDLSNNNIISNTTLDSGTALINSITNVTTKQFLSPPVIGESPNSTVINSSYLSVNYKTPDSLLSQLIDIGLLTSYYNPGSSFITGNTAITMINDISLISLYTFISKITLSNMYSITNNNILNDLTIPYYSSQKNIGQASITINKGDIIATFIPKQYDINKNRTSNGNENSYPIVVTATNTYNCNQFSDVTTYINFFFQQYKDNNNNAIFSDTNMSFTLNSTFTSAIFSLSTKVNKQLNASNYSIQFTDQNNAVGTNNIGATSWSSNLKIDPSMTLSTRFYDLSAGSTETNYDLAYAGNTIIRKSNNQVVISGYSPIELNNQLVVTKGINDTVLFKAYEDGVNDTSNDITITVPQGIYSQETLINELNSLISTNANSVLSSGTCFIINKTNSAAYISIKININRIYKAADYELVFYDPLSFATCIPGTSSIRNTTWDTTLGWLLGFHSYTVYILSSYATTTTTSISITGDTVTNTNIYNYVLLCLDDFNQNHLNDGLVTVIPKDTSIPLPSYANRYDFQCDPATNQLVYNTTAITDYKKLTQNQIYSITQIANSVNSNAITTTVDSKHYGKSYGTGPYVEDVFGLVPIKTSGLSQGQPFIEYGGTLQAQERTYFGPVNISRMRVKLITDRGDTLNLNNANWSFSLVCQQLNKLTPSNSKK